MKSHHLTLKWPLLVTTLFFTNTLSANAQEKRSPLTSSRLHIDKSDLKSPVATFTTKDYQSTRTLHDFDSDGWCDLWCSFFPKNPKIEGRDSDGDGMTDYEEMVLMQDPNIANPLPRHLTARDEMEQARARKAKQNKTATRLTEKHYRTIQQGIYNVRLAAATKRPPLPTRQEKQEDIRTFAGILQTLYEPESQRKGARSKAFQELKREAYLPTSYAARMIKADHLWPGGEFAYHDATGASPSSESPLAPIGVWEEGKMEEPYPAGYSGRISFGALQSLSVNEHATEVAQVLAHPGPNLDLDFRGVAYEANLKFYDFLETYPEMAAEAAGLATTTSEGDPLPMLFSNHSYSPPAGWQEASEEVDGIIERYINWLGPRDFAGPDPEFGAYTWDSKTIDTIIYHAQTYLPVYAAGNDADDQGPFDDGSVSPYTYGLGRNYVAPADAANRSDLFHPRDAGEPVAGAPTPDAMSPYLGEASGSLHGEDTVLGLAYDTIPSTGCAKNNLTVGAIYGKEGYRENDVEIPAEIGLSHFSSIGPIDDGRIKPDLVGPATFAGAEGQNIHGGGTSLAAPAVTGTLALLQEINHDNGGPSRLASTWKALVLNTAIDCTEMSYLALRDNGLPQPNRADEWLRVTPSHLGPVADSADLIGPDYFYGWGLINAEAAASLLIKDLQGGETSNHLCEHFLTDPSNDNDPSNNLEISIPITHDGDSPEMRIMICWTDPPYQKLPEEPVTVGAINPDAEPPNPLNLPDPTDRTSRLVNNLDLKVIDPNGDTHYPWVLNHLTPLAKATRGENNLDNVEQVVIATPIPGTYIIKVSHKGQLKSSELVSGSWANLYDEDPLTDPVYRHVSGTAQAFSLAISGNNGPTPIGPTLEMLDPIPAWSNQYSLTLLATGFTGVRYRLEGSDTLHPDDWTDLVFNNAPIEFTLSSDAPYPMTFLQPAVSHRFYRVREVAP